MGRRGASPISSAQGRPPAALPLLTPVPFPPPVVCPGIPLELEPWGLSTATPPPINPGPWPAPTPTAHRGSPCSKFPSSLPITPSLTPYLPVFQGLSPAPLQVWVPDPP